MIRLLFVAAAAFLVTAGASAAAVAPNDPAWPDQWAARQIGLPQAWEQGTGDASVVIATIDTGVNPIPDLEGALVPGWDFVENDADPQDTHGHGTRVASVIAARGNNGIAMAGHCWGCRIMPIRVSAGGSVSADRMAAGIRWAVDHGARIVNVSLTHLGAAEPVEAQAVSYAVERGVLVTAAAGNKGSTSQEQALQYPAAYPGVLSVGATDDSDTLYFWSTRGPWVALTAPGCHMVVDATIPPGTICGTSFTPAAVAGLAGLLFSRNPSLTAAQVSTALTATARPVAGVAFGRIDAPAAFQWLGLAPPTSATPAPTPVSAAPQVRAVPRPGQLYVRDSRFETGTFRRGFRITFRVGRGRFELQLLTTLARDCTLTLRSVGELVIALPAEKSLLSLSATVPAGRYTAEATCRGARDRQYSLGVIAMFPRGS